MCINDDLGLLQTLSSAKGISDFTPAVLVENGLASKNELIKVLGTGELSDKINVTAHAFSASAKEAIEGKGGTATIA